MSVCPQCGFNLEEKHNFCPSCGYDLRQIIAPEQENSEIVNSSEPENNDLVICDICGEETPTESGYCTSCGANLTGKELKAPPAEKEKIPEQKMPPAVSEPVKQEPREKVIPNKSEPVQKKTPAPAVQKKQPQKTQAAKEKTAKPVASDVKQKSISPVQIWGLIAGLFFLGAVILYVSGVFGTGSSSTANTDTTANAPAEQQKPRISLEDFQRLNDLENTVKKDSSNMSTVLELAHGLNDAGRYEDAIKYYNMYLKNDPRNVDVLVDKGVCYFEMKDYAHAKNVMRKAIQINPRHQIGNFNLGIVNFSAGNLDSAKIWWKKAIEIDPNSEIGKKSKDLLDSN